MESKTKKVSFRRSLRTKITATYIVIVVAVILLLNTYPVLVSQDLVYQSKHASLQSQASVIASALAGPEPLTAESVERTIGVLGTPGVRQMMVTDPTGRILYDYDDGEQKDTEGYYALIWEVTTALRSNAAFHSEYQDGSFHSYAAVPVTYRGMLMGAVCLYEDDPVQGALLLGIQGNLRSISIVICMVAVAMSLVFSQALTRRVASLLRAIRVVREGEYSHRVSITGGDEFALLGGEFNELTDRLQTTEEVRRRFVSDASHELKTPLASIRLLTDSILQSEGMDTETAQEFVHDIGQEAERLTRITEKLLTLTRLDAAPPAPAVPVDTAWVAGRVCHMLLPLARSAQVQLETRLQEDCLVLATEDDLYQIVFNLVENAVKYNHPGGSVTVTVTPMERYGAQWVILRVEDTGVGIPEEDLTKVFDRFYRVDKARSRAAGGTGLGLSIVRDTARQYGGAVTARRREPEGSCFEVTFRRCGEEGEAL